MLQSSLPPRATVNAKAQPPPHGLEPDCGGAVLPFLERPIIGLKHTIFVGNFSFLSASLKVSLPKNVIFSIHLHFIAFKK